MYCALDRIDLAATVEGRDVAVQTDHRSREEIERELALSVLFALTRVVNARQGGAEVHYVVADPPPELTRAVTAAGAVISRSATRLPAGEAPRFEEGVVGELADECFRELAQRAARAVGTRDLALALRMLEDQTFAAPPPRDDPARFWRRVVELAALGGELVRARFEGVGWVVSDRAVIPFGLALPLADPLDHAMLFPTNRAQRLIECADSGHRDHSLFELLTAAEETLQRPPAGPAGRLMPSLRMRDSVELDELVWRALLPEAPRGELPIVVCGIDGESTFGMIREGALARPADDVWAEALANLAAEPVELAELAGGELAMLAVSGSFYAAEKLLDRSLLRALHDRLAAPVLLAATPARGGLLVAAYQRGADARFAAIVREKHAAAASRAISPVVWIVEDGRVAGVLGGTAPTRADTSGVRAETSPELPQRKRK